MVAQSIAYVVSSIFTLMAVLVLWHWWSSSDADPKHFWGAILYLSIAYLAALIGGV